jgi:hypothetical protein
MAKNVRMPDTIVSYNTKVGRAEQEVVASIRDILDDNPKTDVLVLQEAEGYVSALRRAFTGPNKGWYVYAQKGWSESRMNPVMVRKDPGYPKRDYEKGWDVLRNRTHWIGPVHGNDHPGRTWTWVLVGGLYVLSLHRATDGNGKNKRAYWEEAQRLEAFFERGNGDRDIVVFGDTNTGLGATHDGSMRQIRHEVGGKLIADLDEPGIDYALTSRSVSGTVVRTRYYGSDHKAAVMRGITVS